MMRELSKKQIVLIPLLIGDIKIEDIPPDLRGKSYVDFRDGSGLADAEFGRLLALLKPEIHREKELVLELRQGLPNTRRRVSKLRDFALQYPDQRIQMAALTGLEKVGTPEAIVAITQRLLNDWGVNTLNHSLKRLAKLGDVGGYVALSAAIFWDERSTSTILEFLVRAHRRDHPLVAYLKEHSRDGAIPLISIYAGVADHASKEISAALRYSSQYWYSEQKAPFYLPRLPRSLVSESKRIVDGAVPGLSDMIAREMTFRGFSEEEDASHVGPAHFLIDDSVLDRVILNKKFFE
jgi:hypothetical protein